jgi:hypothetical protein
LIERIEQATPRIALHNLLEQSMRLFFYLCTSLVPSTSTRTDGSVWWQRWMWMGWWWWEGKSDALR